MKLTSTLGIGVDIVKTQRFHQILANKNAQYIARFSQRILHPKHELHVFEETSDINHRTRILAGTWAIKEAIYKTLDSEDQKSFQFKDWFRYYNSRGKPLIGSTTYSFNDEEFLLSISHDQDVLIASVLRQRIVEVGQ